MKKKLNLPLLLIFVVIASGAWKNFNFETFEFEKFWLGMLYLFTMLLIVVLMFKPEKKKQ
ncbi:hypothetical protein [Sphingobacterium griseoflavum]|uniref:Uncharacterized protein n=1 Tax=Sphingobacterium griseoflavum TaxID=1474952 RepID=A0ABQ3HU88_9SPHI|nr:hypothetical protein [Sphingobacterium griseoflavum]GHE32078.1 hypothetical protein GCM10017764_14070 [Sphingobacterium griseoflavum]